MKDRIAKIIKKEQLTSQQFAEIIDIQSSTISHILAGRNLPSFKIISNLLERFPKVSPDWLIFGKGEMFREANKQDASQVNSPELDEIHDEFTKLNFDTDILSEIRDNTVFSPTINEPIQSENNIIEDRVLTDVSKQPIGAKIPVITSSFSHYDMNISDPEETGSIKNFPLSDESDSKLKEKIVDRIIIIYCDKTFEILDHIK